MPIVLIAAGANDLKIPCRIFDNFGEAEAFCDKLFLPHAEVTKKENTVDGSTVLLYNCDLDDLDNDDISDVLFTNHYYGCGGPYRFILTYVGYDSKFVGFDLD